MDDNKVWWQSKSVWGSIVAVLAGVAGAFGLNIDGAGQEIIATSIVGIVGAVGGLIALWGRIRADKKLTATKP